MKIDVNDAHLKTAIVEIKSLVVSGKQVTLAVFRQLEEELLITNDGQFAGMPWGKVNYHPDRACKDYSSRAHLHVVWQKGSELRRARIEEPYRVSLWHEHGPLWMDAAVLEGWRPQKPPGYNEPVLVTFPCGGTARIFPSDEATSVLRDSYDKDASLAVLKERVKHSAEELQGWVDEELREDMANQQALKDRWKELKALPQLFIAV